MKSIKSTRSSRRVRAILLLFGIIVATTAARAQLVVFNFTGTSPAQNTPWTSTSTLASGITLTGWTLGNVTGSSTNNRFTATNWAGAGSSFSTASADNVYITFSITPTSGNQLSLSGATITYTLQNSGTGPDFYSVRSSVDSFGSDLSASSTALNTAGATTSTSLTLPTSVSYTGLTGAVEFRIYGWGASSGLGTLSVNAWSMTGGVSAIPEPSTYAAILGGVVLIGALWQRRRTRAASV